MIALLSRSRKEPCGPRPLPVIFDTLWANSRLAGFLSSRLYTGVGAAPQDVDPGMQLKYSFAARRQTLLASPFALPTKLIRALTGLSGGQFPP